MPLALLGLFLGLAPGLGADGPPYANMDPGLAELYNSAYEYSLQSASHIVLASVVGFAPQYALVQVIQSLRGPAAPGDTLRYRLYGESHLTTGDRALLFLHTSSKTGDLIFPMDPLCGYLLPDSQFVWFASPDTIRWSSARASILHALATFCPDSLFASADVAVKATLVGGLVASQTAPSQYRPTTVALHIADSTDSTLAAPGSVLAVVYPLPAGRPWPLWRWVAPILRTGDTGLFFLDRDQQGRYYFHGGLYSAWIASGDSLIVRHCDDRSSAPPLHVQASVLQSTTRHAFQGDR